MEEKKYEEIIENLFILMPLIKKKLIMHDKCKEEIDLTPTHFHILFSLEEVGMIATTHLAKQLMISNPNMTPLIQKLMNRHYIERIQNEEDRRYIYIQLTKEGKDLLKNIKLSIMEQFKLKIKNLNDQDIEKLSNSLFNLKEILEKI